LNINFVKTTSVHKNLRKKGHYFKYCIKDECFLLQFELRTLFGNKIYQTWLRPSWSYGSWIYNYLWNQCLSPLMLWVRILLRQCVLDTTLCDKVCHWLATGQWFSPGTPVFSTNKTDYHDITEILLKMMLNTINLKP